MNTNYKIVNEKHVGYFMFEEDQDDLTESGDDFLGFYTGWDGERADNGSPEDVYDDLHELLVPYFPDIEIGAAESYHIIEPVLAEEHKHTMKELREVLLKAGWREIE